MIRAGDRFERPANATNSKLSLPHDVPQPQC
jgi:hypothetical protein